MRGQIRNHVPDLSVGDRCAECGHRSLAVMDDLRGLGDGDRLVPKDLVEIRRTEGRRIVGLLVMTPLATLMKDQSAAFGCGVFGRHRSGGGMAHDGLAFPDGRAYQNESE